MSMGMVHQHNLNMPTCQFAAYNPSLYAKGKSSLCVCVCVLDSTPSPFTFSPLAPHVCSCSVLYAFVLCLCEMQMQLKWKNAKRNIEQRLHALVSCMRLHVRACPYVCACLCVHSANAKLMHFILCNRKGENSANLAMRIKLARNSRKLHHIDLTTSNAPRSPPPGTQQTR